jgi:hypothetical protein
VILAVPLMWVMTNVRPVPTLPSGQPDPKFNDAKGVSRLSDASPDEFRKYFQPLFEQVEARGIELAGIVVGNEHNWAISNGDFTLPGQGRALGRADLDTDPEGKAVARGLLQYLKVLAVAKEMRDQSRVNRRTPLITFGMFDPKPPHYPTAAMQLDAVTVPATLDFLREHGLDQLVDVYGIHTYPWPDWTAEETWDHLDHQTLVDCRAPGAHDGKPCWLTEWGFQSTTPCPAGGAGPIQDAKRTALVTTVTKHLHPYVESRRLIGLDYYSWNSGPDVASPPAPLSIFRCGELTESGRLAIQRP